MYLILYVDAAIYVTGLHFANNAIFPVGSPPARLLAASLQLRFLFSRPLLFLSLSSLPACLFLSRCYPLTHPSGLLPLPSLPIHPPLPFSRLESLVGYSRHSAFGLDPVVPPLLAVMAATADYKLPTDSKYEDYDYPTTAPEPQAGHPGHTTPEQNAQVEQLRMQLEQMGYTERLDTLTLLRFLRARKFDVEAAKTMYV